MQTLDISQINILAPYPVWYEGEEILFKTDYNILYSVAFELDDMLGLTELNKLYCLICEY